MMEFIESLDWLSPENNKEYGTLPIPTPRDGAISALLRAWLNLDEPKRLSFLSRLPKGFRFALLAYSERMASFAVRTHDKECVVLGLLALGLDEWCEDWRDNATILCLHYDAAKRIGLDPDSLFEETANLLPLEPAGALRSFILRSTEDKSLGSMGYVVDADPDGLRYRRTW